MDTTIFYRGQFLTVLEDRYHKPANTCLRLVDANTGEPYGVATINAEPQLADGYVLIKNHAENEGIYDALVAAGVVSEAVNVVQVGYATALVCRLLI